MGDNAQWSPPLGAWEKTGERLSRTLQGPPTGTAVAVALVESVQSSRQ